ncbi:hypothetical protein [Piscirickettsia litoralis]|uniref:Uncharacterized protein n=1 Tax=Piscirickettsia litoralis TaxID=1891921 RepID=A0ABX3A025_9GAMM|nr:hypothetical protein [Piscirickettsia litoralis]ODN41964.1 hypothetical protein BGC07_02055 [Piscirickettsia litoralis]
MSGKGYPLSKSLLPLFITLFSMDLPSFASTSQSERLDILEQKVDELSSASEGESWADKVSFNGFATVMAGKASNDADYAGFTEETSVNNGSLVALQWNFDLTENMQAVAQLVARGDSTNNWKPEFEWAYLSYMFENGFKVKAGKYRIPLFMYSDYLDVSYAQPWIRPPVEVYGGVPTNSISGLDMTYDIEFEESNLSFQPFLGTNDTVRNVWGLAAAYTMDDWTFRGVFAQGKMGPSLTSAVQGAISVYPSVTGLTGQLFWAWREI